MWLTDVVKRIAGGTSVPAWYTEKSNAAARLLDCQPIWGTQDPNTCMFPVDVGGKVYFAGTCLYGPIVSVMILSRLKEVTPAITADMSRRNKSCPLGAWLLSEGMPVLKLEILAQDFTPERVARAVQTMLPEAMAFDGEHAT